MRFILFILITYAIFHSSSFFLGEQQYFFENESFHVLVVPDQTNPESLPIIIKLDELHQFSSEHPLHNFIPSRQRGVIINKENGEQHRVEYTFNKINDDYSQAEVTYFIKNNKTISNYLVQGNEVHALSTTTPRNKLVIAYVAVMIFLGLALTVFVVYLFEPRYKKYLKKLSNKYDLHLGGNKKVRLGVRCVLFFYTIPAVYFLFEIINNLESVMDLVFVGIVSALLLSLAVAIIWLNNRAVSYVFVLLLMIVLFPSQTIS